MRRCDFIINFSLIDFTGFAPCTFGQERFLKQAGIKRYMLELMAFMIISAEPSSTVLEFSGNKRVEFFGLCVSKETGEQKRIEGVTPAKIYLDVNIEKCSIKKKTSEGTLKIRLFHNQELVTDKTLSPSSSGIELVIPFF